MTTYQLTMTPADGSRTVKRGLTQDEALQALAALMYGDIDQIAAPAEAEVVALAPAHRRDSALAA